MYHELTVWSRGIIMDSKARDVASCIAIAARNLGYYADNVSGYADDPDLTNCLVRRYARFGDTPIADRVVYDNPDPDLVVLAGETITEKDGQWLFPARARRQDRESGCSRTGWGPGNEPPCPPFP